MEAVFNKIFESTVLTEESKNEFKAAFTQALAEAVSAAKEKAEQDVKAELAEQFVTDKQKLIEALDSKAEQFLTKELAELHADVDRFRDLEVEYAEKLVEARKELAEVVKNDFKELINGLDTFLESRLRAEAEELREDIEEARKRAFGEKIFEAFRKEFKNTFQNEDATYLALEETKSQLAEASKTLNETVKELKAIKRDKELSRVLEPLTGKSKEVMEAILKTIPTEKLEETYNAFIGRVLHESAVKVEEKSEKDHAGASVLAEKDTSTEKLNETQVVLKTGDNQVLVEENANAVKKALSKETYDELRRNAGITS